MQVQVTAENATPLDIRRARTLTDKIKKAADGLWRLIEEAHTSRAWAVLGYKSWAQYVTAEFDMSKQRSYQLLDQAKVTRELEEATGAKGVVIPERAARLLKPRMESAIADVRARIDAGEAPEEVIADLVDRAGEEPPVVNPYAPKASAAKLQQAQTNMVDLMTLSPEAVGPRIETETWMSFRGWVRRAEAARRTGSTKPRRSAAAGE